jgi:hypothetical protein
MTAVGAKHDRRYFLLKAEISYGHASPLQIFLVYSTENCCKKEAIAKVDARNPVLRKKPRNPVSILV